jgi:hypothetical protein
LRINFKEISKFVLALVQLSFASTLARLMLSMEGVGQGELEEAIAPSFKGL